VSGWQAIPTGATRPPGGGLGGAALATRLALAMVALGAVSLLGSVLLPLSDGSPADEVEREAAAEVRVDGILAQLDSRFPDNARANRLGRAYLFTSGRSPIPTDAGVVIVEDDAGESPTDAGTAPEVAAAPVEVRDPGSAIRVIRVESAESVGGSIRESFNQLILRGIHSNRSGELVALIDFTGGRVEQATVRAMAGDRFTEPKHKDHDWRVVVIDPQRNRVVVERQERRLALALFGTGAADLSPVIIQPEGATSEERIDVAPDGTIVVRRRPDEAVAELRQEVGAAPAGQKPITFDDLADLLQLMRDLDGYAERERIERERRSRPE